MQETWNNLLRNIVYTTKLMEDIMDTEYKIGDKVNVFFSGVVIDDETIDGDLIRIDTNHRRMRVPLKYITKAVDSE